MKKGMGVRIVGDCTTRVLSPDASSLSLYDMPSQIQRGPVANVSAGSQPRRGEGEWCQEVGQRMDKP